MYHLVLYLSKKKNVSSSFIQHMGVTFNNFIKIQFNLIILGLLVIKNLLKDDELWVTSDGTIN
jgi:hypothetical protein